MSGCDVQRQSTSGGNDGLEGGLLLSLLTASERLTETIEVLLLGGKQSLLFAVLHNSRYFGDDWRL